MNAYTRYLALLLALLAVPAAGAVGGELDPTPQRTTLDPAAATADLTESSDANPIGLNLAPTPAAPPASADVPFALRILLRDRDADAGVARADAGPHSRALDTHDSKWARVGLEASPPVLEGVPNADLLLAVSAASVVRPALVFAEHAPQLGPTAQHQTLVTLEATIPVNAHVGLVFPAAPDLSRGIPTIVRNSTRQTEPADSRTTHAAATMTPVPMHAARAAAFTAAAALLIMLPTWALYHQVRGCGVLDQATRAKIYALVKAQPGLTPTDIGRELRMDPTTARYHLRRLVQEGLISQEGPNFFAIGSLPVEKRRAALAARESRDVLDAVLAAPGATKSEIAEALGRSRATIAYHLTRLENAGLVRCERAGRTVRVWAQPDAHGSPAT